MNLKSKKIRDAREIIFITASLVCLQASPSSFAEEPITQAPAETTAPTVSPEQVVTTEPAPLPTGTIALEETLIMPDDQGLSLFDQAGEAVRSAFLNFYDGNLPDRRVVGLTVAKEKDGVPTSWIAKVEAPDSIYEQLQITSKNVKVGETTEVQWKVLALTDTDLNGLILAASKIKYDKLTGAVKSIATKSTDKVYSSKIALTTDKLDGSLFYQIGVKRKEGDLSEKFTSRVTDLTASPFELLQKANPLETRDVINRPTALAESLDQGIFDINGDGTIDNQDMAEVTAILTDFADLVDGEIFLNSFTTSVLDLNEDDVIDLQDAALINAEIESRMIDVTPPAIGITSNLLTNDPANYVLGFTVDGVSESITGADLRALLVSGTDLVEGDNLMRITRVDAAGNESTLDFTLIVDTTPPDIVITSTIPVMTDNASLTVAYEVYGVPLSQTFSLVEGVNNLQIRETDLAGNVATYDFSVEFIVTGEIATWTWGYYNQRVVIERTALNELIANIQWLGSDGIYTTVATFDNVVSFVVGSSGYFSNFVMSDGSKFQSTVGPGYNIVRTYFSSTFGENVEETTTYWFSTIDGTPEKYQVMWDGEISPTYLQIINEKYGYIAGRTNGQNTNLPSFYEFKILPAAFLKLPMTKVQFYFYDEPTQQFISYTLDVDPNTVQMQYAEDGILTEVTAKNYVDPSITYNFILGENFTIYRNGVITLQTPMP
jgi:hypothetical protein